MATSEDIWLQRLNAALGLAQRGALREAAAALTMLSAERPRESLPHTLLATLHHQLGDLDTALGELDTAAALAPDDPQVAELRAHLLVAANRHEEAETAARKALELMPGNPRAGFDLACALQAQQRWDEAATAAAALIAHEPGHVEARRLLARCRLMRGDSDAALSGAMHPGLLAEAKSALAIAADFGARGAHEQRLALLRALVEHHPADFACVIALADALLAANHEGEALTWVARAAELRPSASQPQKMRAAILLERGETQTGLALFRELLERGQLDAVDEQRYLISLHYDLSQNPDAVYNSHVAWARRHIQSFGTPSVAAPRHQRLRIGWASPRFNEGPVARFLTGLLRVFDREQHEHVLIELHALRDECTDALEALADEVLPAHGLDDDELLTRLRDVHLDVLVDLAGHAPFSRPRVLAQRIAPVQLSWLDYFDTTGLPNMDGWISDPWLSPPDSPQRFSERLLHLQSGRFCYTPADCAPEPKRIGNGAPVFVSFNRTAKLNNAVIDAWARILDAVPDAHMLIGAGALDDPDARDFLRKRFSARGIDAARLELQGQRDYPALLAAYRSADIALDPFPFSGCTTSCDALWMGVPVITLPGWSVVSRQTASLLWRLQHPQWVARDVDDYVALAVALAKDVDALRRERASLRQEVARHLCDAPAQAAEFAALLRQLVDETPRRRLKATF